MSDDPRATENLASLYRDTIRRHATAPVGYRQPIAATHRHEEYNPLCGDRIELQLQIDGERIEAAAFDGEACAICTASASMLCELAPGRAVAALLQLCADLQQALDTPPATAAGAAVGAAVGAASAAIGPDPTKTQSRLKPLLQPLLPKEIGDMGIPADLHALLGVRPYPSRIRCATLPWTAAQRALSDLGGNAD